MTASAPPPCPPLAPLPRTGSRRSPGHTPLDRERVFGSEHLLVTKTDTDGTLTYTNTAFADATGYRPAELIGHPHTILRHPDFPIGMSALLWNTMLAGEEFVHVAKILAKDGGYLWVIAQNSPSFDIGGDLVGYHTVRRAPERAAIAAVAPLYAQMTELEAQAATPEAAAAASVAWLGDRLAAQGRDYDAFIWGLVTRSDTPEVPESPEISETPATVTEGA